MTESGISHPKDHSPLAANRPLLPADRAPLATNHPLLPANRAVFSNHAPFPTNHAPLPSRAREQAVTNTLSRPRRRTAESGYAMLLVFALSAAVAIGLYQQLPRAAFESQREKEQLLIDHGEQYKRAIQLYYRKFSRYPAKLEDLENTGNIRFLRKRFKDPMTGKDEWRLVHMGPGGQLTDSLIKKDDPNKQEWNNKFITENKPAGGSDTGGEQTVNMATRHRISDDSTPTAMPGAGASPANGNPATAANGATPNYPIPGVPGSGLQPGAANQRFIVGPNGQLMPAGAANNSGTTNTGSGGSGGSVSGNGGYSSSSVGSNGGYGNSTNSNPYQNGATAPSPTPGVSPFGAPVNSQYQGQSPYPTAYGSNQPGNFTQPGQTITPGQMINNLLTQPRPGGAPSGIGTPVTGGLGGTTVGGLAGVATTYKGKGIHVYNDQDEYQKWEFYYDLSKEVAAAQQAGNAAANGNQQTNPNVQQNINTQMNSNTFSNSQSTTQSPR